MGELKASESHQEDLSGTTLDHFRIEAVVGRGGMGVVYRAVDERLHRFVALKVLLLEISQDPERRSRFLREARVAASLGHPNIAGVYEVGEDRGRIFIAMEFVEGQTLRACLSSPMLLGTALRLAAQIARGMAGAHDKGVLHRDLKPDNVMVTPEGIAKILDFGVAKQLTPAEIKTSVGVVEHVTAQGFILGTPGYMSPEQAMGRTLDHRSDIFSFGVLLYEMTTGGKPFTGSAMDMLIAVARDTPAPPSSKSPRVNAELERVILRCMARQPKDRYPTARVLCDALEPLAGGTVASSAILLAAQPSSSAMSTMTMTMAGGAGVTSASVRPAPLASRVLPSGTVTLLASDVESSIQLLQDKGDRFDESLRRYHALQRELIARHGGHVVDTTWDGATAVFATAESAVVAASSVQRAMHAERWPDGCDVQVRMGIHTGEPKLTGDRYVGLDVHRAVCIGASAGGGRVLLSAATRDGLKESRDVVLQDLGLRRVQELRYPEHLFELEIAGLERKLPSFQSVAGWGNSLPAQPTTFIGRAEEIESIVSMLRRRDLRLVTLSGPGGTGKTRLSLEVGRALLGDFEAGVVQVLLASVTDPELVPAMIGQALGVHELPGKPILESVKARIGASRMLLLLDNFEQVVGASPAIAELLAACSELKLLVTTRQPLKLRAEREYPVPPLTLPSAAPSPRGAPQAPCEAVRLFVERVRDVKPSFELTPENEPVLEAIVTRLDGLPLAIELAASRMRMLTPQSILDRLHDRLGFLKGGARDLAERQQTLRAAINWSYNLLDEAEKTLFRRISVFQGGFSPESAEEVCGFDAGPPLDVFEGLSSLSDKSLLTQNEVDGEPRLATLETIHEYALGELKPTPDFAVARARHAAHFVSVVEERSRGFMGRDQRRSIGWMITEADNVRAALSWAIEQPTAETTSRLMLELVWYWVPQGHLAEARGWATRALEQTARLGRTRARAEVLEVAGWLSLFSGDFPGAFPFSEESVAIYRELGTEADSARAKIVLGSASAALGKIPEGPELLLEACATCRERGDDYGRTVALIALGEVARAMEEKDQARAYYEEAMVLLRAMKNTFWPGLLIQNLAHFQLHDGDWRGAARLLVETLELGLEYDYPMMVNLYLAAMAGVAVVRGEPAEGVRLLGTVDALLKSLGASFEPTDQAELDRNLTAAKSALGEDVFAAAFAEGMTHSRGQAIAATIKLRS